MKSRICIPARLLAALLASGLPCLAVQAQEDGATAAASAPLAAASAPTAPASAPAPDVAAPPPPAPRFGFDGVLLGGFIDGQWVAAAALQNEERWRPWRLWGGEECRLRHFSGAVNEDCTVTADPRDHPDEDEHTAALPGGAPRMGVQTPARSLGAGDALLALVDAPFAPQPRTPQLLPTGNATYRKLVARHLAENGLRGARPHIEQLIRVDLDGDGADEVLIVAQNVVDATDGAQAEIFSFAPDAPLMHLRDAADANAVPASARAGNYSIILLQRVDGGKVHTLPLASAIAARGRPAAPPRVHRIAAIADLNGDGTMEIITSEARHGALRYRVHEIDALEARRVLNADANAAR